MARRSSGWLAEELPDRQDFLSLSRKATVPEIATRLTDFDHGACESPAGSLRRNRADRYSVLERRHPARFQSNAAMRRPIPRRQHLRRRQDSTGCSRSTRGRVPAPV
jgi:hypothetical protein